MLDGLITFFGSHHALRAESTLRRGGLATELIPGPKELSPNCGVALRFEFEQRHAALKLLGKKHVEVDEIRRYVPRTDEWHRPPPAPKRRLWKWARQ